MGRQIETKKQITETKEFKFVYRLLVVKVYIVYCILCIVYPSFGAYYH